MNHYPHHIGDFNNATRHLTRVERSLYRDMLDLYYDTEQPLNGDTNKLARRLLASSEEEHAAMSAVLDEFFVLEESGWHNARCDAEIAKYKVQIEQASNAGKASAAKRLNRTATQTNARKGLDERKSNDRSAPVQQNGNDRSTTVGIPLNQPEPEPEPIKEKVEKENPKPDGRRGSRLPCDWKPNPELLSWAKAQRADLDMEKTIASFKDYWLAKAGKDGTKLDWDATFRNWVRNDRAGPASLGFGQQSAVARVSDRTLEVLEKTMADRVPMPAAVREQIQRLRGRVQA